MIINWCNVVKESKRFKSFVIPGPIDVDGINIGDAVGEAVGIMKGTGNLDVRDCRREPVMSD